MNDIEPAEWLELRLLYFKYVHIVFIIFTVIRSVVSPFSRDEINVGQKRKLSAVESQRVPSRSFKGDKRDNFEPCSWKTSIAVPGIMKKKNRFVINFFCYGFSSPRGGKNIIREKKYLLFSYET